jgi:quercetin dioxygenase-like cupin family protein
MPILLLWFLSVVVPGQDAVTVNPQIAKVEFENNDIRIVRVRYGPHQNLAMHSHPAKLAVCLTGGFDRTTGADGKMSEAHPAAGDFFWAEPTKHAVWNLSDEPLEFAEVELKHATSPGVAVSIGPQPKYAEEPNEPIPVQLEPHHHPKFQNQYVRVLDVVIPPGESTYFHKHTYDSVAVVIAGGTSQNQGFGEEWTPPGPATAGRIGFTEDSKKPRLHRLKNVGTTTLHILDLEILR